MEGEEDEKEEGMDAVGVRVNVITACDDVMVSDDVEVVWRVRRTINDTPLH